MKKQSRTIGMVCALIAAAWMAPSGASAAEVATGQPVVLIGGPSWPGATPNLITDGNLTTFAHPNTPGGASVTYRIDLGGPVALNQIDIYNRHNCCPERLSDYTVSLFDDDGGSVGAMTFSAAVRSDDTNSGLGGVDSVTAASGTGSFTGRFLELTGPSDVAYALQIAEVFADGTAFSNFAIGKTVTTSGPVHGASQAASNITDGNLSTYSHPAIAQPNYHYTIDLGTGVDIYSINLFNRNDGCCPERLTEYTVSIHRDINGMVGEEVWSALIRGDGTNSGVGGYDTVQEALDAAGRFDGRWVRITGNTDNYNPQIAEVQVFGVESPLQTEAGHALAGLRPALDPVGIGEHMYTLQNPTAQFSQPSPVLTIDQTIDGNTDTGGWGNGPSFTNNVAVWETSEDVLHDGDAVLEFLMVFDSFADHGLGRFRLSATTADRSLFADGAANGGLIGPGSIWTVLDDLLVFDTVSGLELAGGALQGDGSFLIDDTINPTDDKYLILLRTDLSGITGFRLEIFDDGTLSGGGPGLSNSNGNSVLTEFSVKIASIPAPAALPAGLAMLGLVAARRRRTT